jgi:hypothetical protein
MKEIIFVKDLGMKFYNINSRRKYRYGLFICPFCDSNFEARVDMIKAKTITRCKDCKYIDSDSKGESKKRLYKVWSEMIRRCTVKKATRYERYGGRGISFCKDWEKYQYFKEWALKNGYKENLTLDRIDNDGNYEPNNCRWSSKSTQSQNRGLSKNSTSGYKGVTKSSSSNKWRARISVNGKQIYLGVYKNKIDAAKAYDRYVIKNKLEHILNFRKDKK